MKIVTTSLLAVLCLTLSPAAVAQTAGAKKTPAGMDDPAGRPEMAKMHRQMADVHVKMAECLASDKQIRECQKQMSGSCSAMGDMMGKGQGMHGTMGKGLMDQGMMGGCPMIGGDAAPAQTKK